MLANRQLERAMKGPVGLLTLVGVDILINGLVNRPEFVGDHQLKLG